ncbi:MAG: hypothetical protein E3J21_24710 [Anaerolineales bacterium]|nr:MAG: hypothetical protein E3J21_24710 [Anaerolineales bacterium]
MLTMALTPPGLYITVAVIVVLATLIWWQRRPIRRFLGHLRVTEIALGPVKLGPEEKASEKPGQPGVHLKGDFQGARVERIAGRDIVRGETGPRTKGGTPGVELEGKFGQAEVRDLAGRDWIEGQRPPDLEPPSREEVTDE